MLVGLEFSQSYLIAIIVGDRIALNLCSKESEALMPQEEAPLFTSGKINIVTVCVRILERGKFVLIDHR